MFLELIVARGLVRESSLGQCRLNITSGEAQKYFTQNSSLRDMFLVKHGWN